MINVEATHCPVDLLPPSFALAMGALECCSTAAEKLVMDDDGYAPGVLGSRVLSPDGWDGQDCTVVFMVDSITVCGTRQA